MALSCSDLHQQAGPQWKPYVAIVQLCSSYVAFGKRLASH